MKWLALPLALGVATWVTFLGNHAPGTDAALRGLPLDDGWIHLVYARALVEEGGFHYNTGVPEAGMTSPLWVVLLAGGLAVVGPENAAGVVLWAKILSLLCGLAGVVLLYSIARAAGGGRFTGVLAATLFAADPSQVFARASGMEIQLFVALVLLALWQALRGRALSTAAAAGLSLVARPEGVLLLPIYALALWRASRRAAALGRRRLLLAAGIALLPAALYALFCLHATGRPLPNTFYVKFARRNPLDFGLLAFGWRHYVHGSLPWFRLESGTIAALLGVAACFRRDRALAGLVFGSGFVLFAGAMASRDYAPGHYFYWERWVLPSLPLLHLAIAAGVDELRRGFPRLVSRPARSRRWMQAAAVAAALGGLLLASNWPREFRERSARFAWNAQNIEEMNVALGLWVDANLPPDAVVAVNDAGALRYFGRRTTLDLVGLNDHEMLDRQAFWKRFASAGVGWVIVFPVAFQQLVASLPLTIVHQVQASHYTICEAPQDRIIVYRLERGPGSR